MNKRLIAKIVAVLSVSALIIFALGQGCGKLVALKGEGEGSSTAAPSATTPGYNPDAATVSLVYGKQILDHYTTCIGSGTPTERTLQVYDAKKGSVSESGAVGTLTAPMLMAAASISGEVCEDLIQREAAASKRRIFVNFGFGANTLPAQRDMEDAMRRIALSCWGREADQNELDVLSTAISQSFGSSAATNATHDAALFLCTSMLSSLSALVL